MAAASFPSCRAEFNWMLSSDGWNPCRLATPLIANCDNRATPLPAINAGEHYQAPTESTQNPCVCSNVVYALISACSLCQKGSTYTWRDWTAKCAQSFPTGYPRPIGSLSIPSWANFHAEYQSQFDIVRASIMAVGVPNTQSTAVVTPTMVVPPDASSTQVITAPVTIVQTVTGTQTQTQAMTNATTNTTPASVPATASPATTTLSDGVVKALTISSTGLTFGTDTLQLLSSASDAGSQSSPTQSSSALDSSAEGSKGANKGAIAGGVIGGLIFLALLAAAGLWWFKRRQRMRVAPSAAYIASYGAPQRAPSMGQSPFQDPATSPMMAAPYTSPYTDEKRTHPYAADYSRGQRSSSPTLP